MLKLAVAMLCSSALAVSVGAQQPAPVYKQAQAPVPARVADLLSRMTLEEKVAQLQSQATLPDLSQSGLPTAMGIIKKGQVDDAVARKTLSNGIGAFTFIAFGPLKATAGVAQQNAVQDWVLKNTQIGRAHV